MGMAWNSCYLVQQKTIRFIFPLNSNVGMITDLYIDKFKFKVSEKDLENTAVT